LRRAVVAVNSTADSALALLVSGDIGPGLCAVDQAITLHDMHRLGLRRAETIDGSEFIDLYAHGIDDQCVSFPTADRIACGRRSHLRGVCAVHANDAKLIVVVIDKREVAVLLLQDLKIELNGEGE